MQTDPTNVTLTAHHVPRVNKKLERLLEHLVFFFQFPDLFLDDLHLQPRPVVEREQLQSDGLHVLEMSVKQQPPRRTLRQRDLHMIVT